MHNFFYDNVGGALTRTLAIRTPDRAKRAMLGATTNRLHRCPHVTIARDQIPSGRNEIGGLNLATYIDRLRSTLLTVGESLCPNNVSITLHYRMRSPKIERSSG